MKKYHIIIGVIIICLVVASGIYIERQLAIGEAEGFTVMSISTSQAISPDTDLSKTWFTVTVALTGGGESIVGTISPLDFKTFSNYETEYPLEISVGAIDEVAIYNIINEADPIYKYNVDYIGGRTYIVQRGASWCDFYATTKEGYEYAICNWVSTVDGGTWQVDEEQVGQKGAFENPIVKYHANVKVKSSGETYEKMIGSNDASIIFYDSDGNIIATAQWVGSLVTGDAPPNADNYVAIYTQRGFDLQESWGIAHKTEWDTYKSSLISTQGVLKEAASICCAHGTCSCSKPDWSGAITTSNNYADAVLTSDATFTTSPIQNRYDENEASAVVNVDTRLLNPVIVFKVRADWIGVKIPVGRPQIVSTTVDTLYSGEDTPLIVSVKNVGDVQSSFTAKVSGCDPIVQKTTAPIISINSGDTQEFIIPLTTGFDVEEMTKTCAVEVCDYNNPTICDVASVQVTTMPPKVCRPGDYKTSPMEESLYRCAQDGQTWNLIFTCNQTLHARSVVAYDVNYPKNDGYLCSVISYRGCMPGETVEYDGCWYQCTDFVVRWGNESGEMVGYSDEATLLYCEEQGIIDKITDALTPEPTPVYHYPTPTPSPISWNPMDYVSTPPIPGFEAVFAIIGLIGVAYLLLKTEE